MEEYMEYKVKSKVKKLVTGAFKIFFGIIIAILLGLLLGYVIMWLWNWLMPELFGLATIGYWKAVGILALARLLFGGLGSGPSGSSKKSKGERNSRCRPNRWDNVKNDFSKWKNYDKFWEEEGESAYKAYLERSREEKL